MKFRSIRLLCRRLFYKLYLICYLTPKDQIFYKKIYAYTMRSAILQWRNKFKYECKIVSITKIKNNLGDLL